jgi:hypothetical protein
MQNVEQGGTVVFGVYRKLRVRRGEKAIDSFFERMDRLIDFLECNYKPVRIAYCVDDLETLKRGSDKVVNGPHVNQEGSLP